MSTNGSPELVSLTIDGKPVKVPKGTNVIEAAKSIGIEIPHYCYHPNLSIAGNCRMCQVQIKGQAKLEIGCNAVVREGMEVSTQHTSQAVEDAQAATLEFILINHPLDCTVCDQAGHCKLQDYHFEYNARDSRFLENKEHKVKAEPLGPHVMLDGERCILCSRCVRFCDEITETSELGILNRGDRSVIAINQGRELNNPLSGTVVDLCPVGALTHRDWRFNSRIWFTKSVDTVCPGCSTGCNCKVYTRDGEVVQVKARVNQAVNKEWMCDEGRYGFDRFLPKERIVSPLVNGKASSWDDALREAVKIKGQNTVVFLDPHLLLEDMWAVKALVNKHLKGAVFALSYRKRELTKTQAILISPDYAPNYRGFEFLNLGNAGGLEEQYDDALAKFRSGVFKSAIFIGDNSVLARDLNPAFLSNLGTATMTVGILTDGEGALAAALKVVLPGRSVLEKSGLMINKDDRIQYLDRALDPKQGTEAEWSAINRFADKLGAKLLVATNDREVTMALLKSDPRLANLKIATIKGQGVKVGAASGATFSAGGEASALGA